jgi:hypothetical protein
MAVPSLREMHKINTLRVYRVCPSTRFITESTQLTRLSLVVEVNYDNRADGVRLRLWTAVTYCSSPGDKWGWTETVEWYLQGKNWFVHQSSMAILLAQSSSSKAGGTCEGNDEFSLRSISFIFRRIFQHPGLNPRTLGPMANMLTTRLQKTTSGGVNWMLSDKHMRVGKFGSCVTPTSHTAKIWHGFSHNTTQKRKICKLHKI